MPLASAAGDGSVYFSSSSMDHLTRNNNNPNSQTASIPELSREDDPISEEIAASSTDRLESSQSTTELSSSSQGGKRKDPQFLGPSSILISIPNTHSNLNTPSVNGFYTAPLTGATTATSSAYPPDTPFNTGGRRGDRKDSLFSSTLLNPPSTTSSLMISQLPSQLPPNIEIISPSARTENETNQSSSQPNSTLNPSVAGGGMVVSSPFYLNSSSTATGGRESTAASSSVSSARVSTASSSLAVGTALASAGAVRVRGISMLASSSPSVNIIPETTAVPSPPKTMIEHIHEEPIPIVLGEPSNEIIPAAAQNPTLYIPAASQVLHANQAIASSFYTPSQPDEIPIYPGDILTLLHVFNDGWILVQKEIKPSGGTSKGVIPMDCVDWSTYQPQNYPHEIPSFQNSKAAADNMSIRTTTTTLTLSSLHSLGGNAAIHELGPKTPHSAIGSVYSTPRHMLPNDDTLSSLIVQKYDTKASSSSSAADRKNGSVDETASGIHQRGWRGILQRYRFSLITTLFLACLMVAIVIGMIFGQVQAINN